MKVTITKHLAQGLVEVLQIWLDEPGVEDEEPEEFERTERLLALLEEHRGGAFEFPASLAGTLRGELVNEIDKHEEAAEEGDPEAKVYVRAARRALNELERAPPTVALSNLEPHELASSVWDSRLKAEVVRIDGRLFAVVDDRRNNPLEPFPKFEGKPAWGGTEGGVHTADTIAQAVPYAATKGDPDNDDFPVILILNTKGLERLPDIDVIRAAREFAKEYGERAIDHEGTTPIELPLSESLNWFEEVVEDVAAEGPGYPQRGENVMNWLYSSTGPGFEYNLLTRLWAFIEELDPEDQRDVWERALNNTLTDTDKIEIWGQGRYLEPIGPDRVVGVFLQKPWYPTVKTVDPEDDTVPVGDMNVPLSDFLEVYDGYNVVFEDDDDVEMGMELAWGEDRRWDNVEYHGTSWRNFSKALPEIAKQIDPPAIPEDIYDLERKIRNKLFKDEAVDDIMAWKLATIPESGKTERQIRKEVEDWFDNAGRDELDEVLYRVGVWKIKQQGERERQEAREANADVEAAYDDVVEILGDETTKKFYEIARESGDYGTLRHVLEGTGVL